MVGPLIVPPASSTAFRTLRVCTTVAPRGNIVSASDSFKSFPCNSYGLKPAMVTREVLDTGLRLITETMPHVRSGRICAWLPPGAGHARAPESGIAHFVEHMLFKGTDTRSAEDIAQEIDS